MPSGRISGIVFRATIVVVGAVLLWAGWSGFRVWRAWSNVERVEFQTADARIALQNHIPDVESTDDEDASDLPLTEGEVATEVGPGITAGNTFSGEGLRSYLVIGSDQRAETGASRRADVILLVMIPEQADPIFVSIPRDLYLPNPCTSGLDRINATLNGCGDFANGPELLAVTVENFTGVTVDHFAVFDFDGFKKIVDRVGGVEICVDTPVRDLRVQPNPLHLDAGCTIADGETALSWVRSRKTQELADGSWRTVPGVNDLTRNQRQQDLLVQALRRLKGFSSVGEFAGLVEDVSDAFVIDEGLPLSRAVDIAWGLRSIDPGGIVRIEIPVSNYITPGGAYVLIPEASFEETLTAVYPDADTWLASS
jgi:LCP family protein required for cell wall assembly